METMANITSPQESCVCVVNLGVRAVMCVSYSNISMLGKICKGSQDSQIMP